MSDVMTTQNGMTQDVPPPKRPRDHLLDHEYDGIREFDNPTPGWWHVIFLGSVFFSVFYYGFWQFSPLAYSPQEAWQMKQSAATKKLFAALGDVAADVPSMQRLMKDDALMQYAQGVFLGNCAQCHAKDGGGINGVNLTDDSYKNVKVMPDIFNVITNGANNGAMPSWRNNFSDKERVLLAAYIASLRGTHPVNSKAPEGEQIAPWPK
ncbi:MAG: cbb3-type cytochrome c oxidase N-terminal domain-containing protein [Phycisphaerales bacterium]